MARAHGYVTTAISLAQYHRKLGNSGFAVGVKHLGTMTDDAGMLLVNTGKIPGQVNKGHQRDTEGITVPDEPRCLVR